MEALFNPNNNLLTIRNGVGSEPATHHPVHICCVVDVSGSMGDETEVQLESGNRERTGLSILDLVLHSVRAVIKNLNPTDKVSIVSFTSDSKIVLAPTFVSEWTTIDAKIDTMYPQASTNLWAGLKDAMDLVKDFGGDTHSSSILLFTDGIPNIHPPRGYEQSMDRYDGIPCNIHTFGFGYNLDTDVLSNIARKGTGSYNFISDAGMVATVFIHSIANILSECGRFIRIEGYGSIGTLRYGQTRQIFIENDTVPMSKFVTYKTPSNISKTIKIKIVPEPIGVTMERITFGICLMEILEYRVSITEKQDLVIKCMQKITNEPLYNDLAGEVTKAVSSEQQYNKWGVHYLTSLLGAHEGQYCNNFRDPGIQSYGVGTLFLKERNSAEEFFETLPAPKPRDRFGGCGVPSAIPIESMSQCFMNSASGCFSGDSVVYVQSNEKKKVVDLCKGDVIQGNNGLVIVRSIVVSPATDMLMFDEGLIITPWHPIMQYGEWVFPGQITNVPVINNQKCYNLVLENGKTYVLMGNSKTPVVTLGHGLKTNNVVTHPYFGTYKILDDLEKCNVNDNGKIEVSGFIKTNVDGMVTGMI